MMEDREQDDIFLTAVPKYEFMSKPVTGVITGPRSFELRQDPSVRFGSAYSYGMIGPDSIACSPCVYQQSEVLVQ